MNKIIIAGGKTKDLPNELENLISYKHIEQDTIFPKGLNTNYNAIVVIARLGKSLIKPASKFSKVRGIPLILVDTYSDIINGLIKQNIINLSQKEEVKIVKTQEVESTKSVTGMDSIDIRDKYLDIAVNAVKSVFNPGDKLEESDVIDIISTETGLPFDDAKLLLNDVSARGVIVNTIGTTWKRFEENEKYGEDIEPIKILDKKIKRKYSDRIFCDLDILKSALEISYKRKSNGYVNSKEIGVVYKELGGIYKNSMIVNNYKRIYAKTKLVIEDKAKKKLYAPDLDIHVEQPKQLSIFPIVSVSTIIMNSFENILPYQEIQFAIQQIKLLTPRDIWNQSATLSASKISGKSIEEIHKEDFLEEWWNALAYNIIKELKVEDIIGWIDKLGETKND